MTAGDTNDQCEQDQRRSRDTGQPLSHLPPAGTSVSVQADSPRRTQQAEL